MASVQDTITRLPVHARHIGVGAVGAGAHRVCAHTRRSNVGGGGKDSVKITEIGNMALFVCSIFAGTMFSNAVTRRSLPLHAESLCTDDR